jgi:SAM-dependent methyltransferase
MPPEIEFTGERFVPGIAGEIEYEHVHRYAFAAREVAGRRVLDAACGEGYGSALLARTAVTVAAVDIDAATLGHAATRYRAIGNLAFHRASVAALPFGDGSFDVVVSFETIEHLEAADQPRMLAEFARVLAPGGLLILSAPNRPEYSDKRGHVNPFHRHEHDRGELDALIATHFGARRYYAQRVWLGSLLWREDGGEAFVAETGDASGVTPATVPPAMYFLVVAARAAGDLPRDRLGLSLFADVGQQELARLNALLEERLGALGKSDVHVRHLESLVAQRESLVVERDGQLGAQHARIVQFERQEQEHFARLAESDRHAASLRASLDESQASLREAQAALAAQERIIDYRQSLRWWVMLPWLRLRSWWRGRGA